MNKYFLLGFGIWVLGFTAIAVGGCARTVTSKVPGNQIVFNITLNGNADAVSNRYYIILATSEVSTPYPNEYFVAPGEQYDQNRFTTGKDLNYYYTNYLTGWMDFVTLTNNTFYITNGAFVTAEAHSSYLSKRRFIASKDVAASQKITLTLYFTYLSQTPSRLYFNLLAVDSNGYLKDRLEQLDNNFITDSGTVVSGSDPSDPSADPSQDIIGWSVAVQ